MMLADFNHVRDSWIIGSDVLGNRIVVVINCFACFKIYNA